VNTRARSLPGPVDESDLVEEVALDLLAEFEGEPARKLGVRVSNLSFADEEQVSLESWDGESSSAGAGAGVDAPQDGDSGVSEGRDDEAVESGSGETARVRLGQRSLSDFAD
jgi:DNA polymerase IV (DinB-like DNA polymerase)